MRFCGIIGGGYLGFYLPNIFSTQQTKNNPPNTLSFFGFGESLGSPAQQ
jgi:hypothetical protein